MLSANSVLSFLFCVLENFYLALYIVYYNERGISMHLNISDIFKRRFTKELLTDSSKDVYDLFQWKKVHVKLMDYKTGNTLVHMKDLEFPIHYSQNACDIIASKYFRRSGVPGTLGYENSLKQVVFRVKNYSKPF